jgi:hypothetical protein
MINRATVDVHEPLPVRSRGMQTVNDTKILTECYCPPFCASLAALAASGEMVTLS